MTQLTLFQPEQNAKPPAAPRPIKWATPVTRAEMIAGTKGMAAKKMNTDIWPEYPELYKGPRDKYIVLMDYEDMASVMAGTRKQRKITLGPFHTSVLEYLPLDDRRKVLDVMIANPYFRSIWSDKEKPVKKLDPATLEIVRKRRLMKRVLKKFGMFADEMIRQEYVSKKMPWGKSDDALWAEEKQKALKPKKVKKRKGEGHGSRK